MTDPFDEELSDDMLDLVTGGVGSTAPCPACGTPGCRCYKM